ncbi:MAG: glycosyltransferase [Desulfobacca sp.]|nr:glycosyltransferase [Desulfobacca sp.]
MSFWQSNFSLLQARPPGVDLLPPLPEEEPPEAATETISGSPPALRVWGEEGRAVTLHSAHDPWKEAEVLVKQARFEDHLPIVALGLGLGYHLLRLIDNLPAERPLLVVEKRQDILTAALRSVDLAPLLTRPGTALLVHDDPPTLLQHLNAQLPQGNGRRLNFWGHPPSLRAENSFYQQLIEGLRGTCGPLPVRRRGLDQESLRVLILNTDYFLIPEILRAFKHLGHQCHLVLIDKRREQGGEILRRILQEVGSFSPDLIFTVNHLGFDREGMLMETFHRCRVPSVSWYVDSPRLILNLYQGPVSDLCSIFVWDRDYLPDVKDLGFDQVYELPLATDPAIFRPRSVPEGKPWQAPVSFVGNSMVGVVQQKLSRLPANQSFQELFQELLTVVRQHPYQPLARLVVKAGLEAHPGWQYYGDQQENDLEAALVWASTRDYRLERVRQLSLATPVIYGDRGWQELLSPPFQLRPEVNYYDELPLVYAASKINFNATSLQMKTAVNQRVFDVPAAGGFLLTDYKEQLGELFRIGDEVICYHHPGEIPELARFYLSHPRQRQRVIERGRRRVLKEHTYVHRLQTMLACLRRSW